ncbi:hypothetical protein V6N12_040567 [Hibiscus sabdariffa]|uniref:Thioredoxin domain-containing protein n=1 Tax=Hibiscus sabdariffa TaxID=183260 RepID=A0ABR2E5W1_9ROSI
MWEFGLGARFLGKLLGESSMEEALDQLDYQIRMNPCKFVVYCGNQPHITTEMHKGVADENQGKLSYGDDDLCPVDCLIFIVVLAEAADMIFLKHNVLDEYDERSEVAERLRITTVPLFHFYKNGVLLEASPSRDKERSIEAIKKYTWDKS